MTALVWICAVAGYALFCFWYVGFRARVTPAEVEQIMELFHGMPEFSAQQQEQLHRFLLADDGKDFVMVNLLRLREPLRESAQKLQRYQKIFLGALLRKAGHPVLFARAAGGYLENVACEDSGQWTATALVRYRSRRDFMEMLPTTIGSVHHRAKHASLQQTFAFPATPWTMAGGPRLVVALVLALVAALVQLAGS